VAFYRFKKLSFQQYGDCNEFSESIIGGTIWTGKKTTLVTAPEKEHTADFGEADITDFNIRATDYSKLFGKLGV
jgi:hypothetical protein